MMTLTLQPATPVSHPYVVTDDEVGIFISFPTAQKAFDWLGQFNEPIKVNIQPQNELVTITNHEN